MGKVTGFLEIDRNDRRYEPASDRIRHFREFMLPLGDEARKNRTPKHD
jgi:glutamate synthase (NADPH/NADH) small chain